MSLYTPLPPEMPPHKDQLGLRINIFFFSTFLIFCVLIVRLSILQFVEGPAMSDTETSREVKYIPLPPVRGIIYDATNTKLAYSVSTQSLYITLQENDYSLETEKGIINRIKCEMLASSLLQVFNKYGDSEEKLTYDQILDAIDRDSLKHRGYEPRKIKSNLTEQEIAYLSEHRSQFPGIEIIEESLRKYNPDTIAVQTVGYMRSFKGSKELSLYKEIDETLRSKDSSIDPYMMYTEEEKVGYDGVEYMFQDQLRGKNGYKKIAINPNNMAEGIQEIVPPVKGADIHLTINKNVQLRTESAIEEQLRYLRNKASKRQPNALTGYAVAMEVDTGNIIAMASMPDYDPNVWRNSGITIAIDDWEQIQGHYQNGAITPYNSGKSGNKMESVLLLGSTVKPLTVLIGLKEGFFNNNTIYSDKGLATFGKDNSTVRNSSGHVFGPLDPAKAIQQSSNAFMIDMVGKRLYQKYGAEGIDVWDEYMKQFGLGVLTGVGLRLEYKGKLEYNNINETVMSRLVYASFGQQGKYTTLQLAQYASTLANRGERIKPQLVSKITDEQGATIATFGREVLNTVEFHPSHWDEVIRGMNTNVSDAFSGFPYDFARKTGTSQQAGGSDGRLKDNGVFIAFAPRQNPKLAVAVVIPEGGFGSTSAAPIARQIFDAYDEEYGLTGTPRVPATESESPESDKEND